MITIINVIELTDLDIAEVRRKGGHIWRIFVLGGFLS